jgi:hypothetical protein
MFDLLGAVRLFAAYLPHKRRSKLDERTRHRFQDAGGMEAARA